jgi:tRNA(fMet)-specific endonuclease VapC
LIIDSSVLIRLERNIGGAQPDFASVLPGPGFVSIVTVAELWVGVFRADTDARRNSREEFLTRVSRTLGVLPFDLAEAREFGRLYAHLQTSGQMIGERDLQIAATAIANGHELMTLNLREFERIPGLTLRPYQGPEIRS